MNVRVTVQEPPAATGEAVEQVAAVLVKSPAFVPETSGLLVNISDPLPVFITVTVIAALVVPSACDPNGTLAGRLTPGPVPDPLSVTVWVAGEALSAKLSVAVSKPSVEGVKVRETVHVPPPAATTLMVEQVAAVIAKSGPYLPVTFGLLLKIREALPVFVSVTIDTGLVVPCGMAPNGSVPGRLTTGAGGTVPVPVSETLCVAGVALSAKLSDAASAANVEGLNVSVTVQLPLAATGEAVEQVMPVIAKSAAFVPETLGLLVKFSGAAPVFISVTIIAGLVTPFTTEPNGKLAGRVTVGVVPVPVSETV